MAWLLTLGGFVLLFGGGEFLVRGAVALSRRARISPLLVGMTVVAFCTSAPELVVSVQSALRGNADIAVGNVVGSNIANAALILGISALIRPMTVDKSDVRPDTVMMLLSSALLAVLGATGTVVRWQGALMVVGLAAYITVQYRREMAAGTADRDWRAEEVEEFATALSVPRALVLLVSGLAALLVGSQSLIEGATRVASAIGVPDAVVGLTVVAVGTSLPELATSVIAAVRGHSDVAVGNVVGSNTFNVLAILGTTSVVTPVRIAEMIARIDIPLMLALLIVTSAVLLMRGRFGRQAGALFLVGYAAYVGYLYAA